MNYHLRGKDDLNGIGLEYDYIEFAEEFKIFNVLSRPSFTSTIHHLIVAQLLSYFYLSTDTIS